MAVENSIDDLKRNYRVAWAEYMRRAGALETTERDARQMAAAELEQARVDYAAARNQLALHLVVRVQAARTPNFPARKSANA